MNEEIVVYVDGRFNPKKYTHEPSHGANEGQKSVSEFKITRRRGLRRRLLYYIMFNIIINLKDYKNKFKLN
jgi:hypothetical protein